MGQSSPVPEAASPRPRRSARGILRWLLRFFLRITAIIAGTLLLVGALASIVYLNRVRLLNQTLALLVEPFRVSVGELDFYPIGVIRITNLHLTPKGAPEGSHLATLPEVVITYRLEELRRTRRLETITLHRPILSLDDATLAALAPPPPSSTDPTPETPSGVPPFPLSRLALFTGDLIVEDGRFRIDLASIPPMAGSWAIRIPTLDFEEGSGLLRTPVSWDLRDIVLGENGSAGQIAAFSGEGRLNSDLTRIELGPIRLDRPALTITPDLFPPRSSAPTASDPIPTKHPQKTTDLLLRSLLIDRGSIALTGFDGHDGRPRIPDLTWNLSFSPPPLRFQNGHWDSEGPLRIALTNLQASSGGLPFLSASSVRGESTSLATLTEEHRLSSVSIEKLDFLGSDESLARFLEPSPAHSTPPGTPSRAWQIDALHLGESSVLVRDLTLGGKPAPVFSTSLRGTLHDLRLGGAERFASEGLQSLVLTQTRLRAPGATPASDPLLSLEHVEIEGKWSDFARESLVDRLVVRGPFLRFTDAALGRWLAGSDSSDASPPRPVNRPVYKARHLEVSGGRLIADSRFADGKVPKIQSGFLIETIPARDGDPYSYRLRFEDLTLSEHARILDFVGPPPPSSPAGDSASESLAPARDEIFHVKAIAIDATATELQRTRRIGKVTVDGAILTVGEGLKTLLGGPGENPPSPSSAPPEKPQEKPQSPIQAQVPSPPSAPSATSSAPARPSTTRTLPSWNLGEIEITRSRVHFESFLPQIEGLQFAIETRLFDVPLSLDGIMAQEKLQKIELAGITIKDPYTSFITVAELPTIFVEFSLAGLARQTVEKIDLIGPSLHVGQGLFWWVDYQRNFREQNEGASLGFEAESPKETKNSWIVRTINATSGKIVIAPTGVPIGAVPFPFNATTNMSEGNIELKLNIPDEDHVYRFPQYKVEIAGLVGDVQFNVPVKDVNNNLVQTFTLKRAKWKEYEARDLYLSVTFDENGVYGKFGGAAYKGYTEGQFNVYLKDEGKWDAWLAGTSLDTGPITSILVPESFLMDGRVSLKLVSEGRNKVVGKTSGEFHSTTPGWFDITKLGTTLENLPPEWNSLQRSLTEIGLGALKRFDYDFASGSLSFLNREGTLDLQFHGDDGTRILKLQAHDERNPIPSAAAAPALTPAPSTSPAPPLPEASSRPAASSRLAAARRNR